MGTYKNMKDYDYKSLKKNLDDQGNVKSALPNINTNPGKRGHFGRSVGHLIGKPLGYMPEDPLIHKKIRAREKARIAKLCKHE